VDNQYQLRRPYPNLLPQGEGTACPFFSLGEKN
jgi:hypothetical protein